MTQFSKVTLELAEIKTAIADLQASSLSLHDRHESIRKLLSGLEDLKPKVSKMKKTAQETSPEKKVYGPSMVQKVLALVEEFEGASLSAKALYSTISSELQAQEETRVEREAQQKAAKEEAEARLEAEREALRRKQEEERRKLEERIAKEAEKTRLEAEAEKSREAKILKAEEEKKLRELEDLRAIKEKEETRKRDEAERNRKEAEEKEALEVATVDGSTKKDSSFLIKIRMATSGKTLEVVLPSGDGTTIFELKSAIEESDSTLPRDRQVLISSGKNLANDRTLSDYNISNAQVIHVVLRPTGAKNPSSTSSAVSPVKISQVTLGKTDLTQILNRADCSLVVAYYYMGGPEDVNMLRNLATRFPSVVFAEINKRYGSDNERLTSEEGIAAYPTVHFFMRRVKVQELKPVGMSLPVIQAQIQTAITSLVGEAAATGRGPTSTARNNMQEQVSKALQILKDDVPFADFIDTVRFLITTIGKVVSNPDVPKYRKLRKSSRVLTEKIVNRPGGLEVIYAFGFKEITEGEEVYLKLEKYDPELASVKTLLQAALDAHGQGQRPQSPQPTGGMDGLGAIGELDQTGNPFAQLQAMMQGMGAGVGGGAGGMNFDRLSELANAMGGVNGTGLGGLGRAGGMPGFGGLPGMEGMMNPEMMGQLMSDPAFMQLMSRMADPEITQAILSTPHNQLLGHPAIQRLMADPEYMQALMQFYLRQQQRGQTGSQMGGAGASNLSGMFAPNPFGGGFGSGAMGGTRTGDQTTGSQTPPTAQGGHPGAGAPNPFMAMMQQMMGAQNAGGNVQNSFAPSPINRTSAPLQAPGQSRWARDLPSSSTEEDAMLAEALRLSMATSQTHSDTKNEDGSKDKNSEDDNP